MARHWTDTEKARQRAQMERTKPGAKRWKRYSSTALGAVLGGYKALA